MTESTQSNLLYYGDNLDILRRYAKDESVDLNCLDLTSSAYADAATVGERSRKTPKRPGNRRT